MFFSLFSNSWSFVCLAKAVRNKKYSALVGICLHWTKSKEYPAEALENAQEKLICARVMKVAVLVLSGSFVFLYEFKQMGLIHVKIISFFSWFTCMGYRLEHCYVLWKLTNWVFQYQQKGARTLEGNHHFSIWKLVSVDYFILLDGR